MGNGFTKFIHGVEVLGKDLGDVVMGVIKGGAAGTALGPEAAVAGGIIGGVTNSIGFFKHIVQFAEGKDPGASGGPTVASMVKANADTRAATAAGMTGDKHWEQFKTNLAQGMTPGAAFSSAGLSRLPGVMANGRLEGVFNRTPGVNPKMALLLGNGAMRKFMTHAAQGGSQVKDPFMTQLYGYGHAMASRLSAPAGGTGSSVPHSTFASPQATVPGVSTATHPAASQGVSYSA